MQAIGCKWMKMEEKKVVTEKSHLSGGEHEDLRIRRDVMEAANTFGEVNLGRHVIVESQNFSLRWGRGHVTAEIGRFGSRGYADSQAEFCFSHGASPFHWRGMRRR